MFYFAAATVLTIELLSTDIVNTSKRVLLAGFIGFTLLLAFIHLVIFRLGSKVPEGVARPRPNVPERLG